MTQKTWRLTQRGKFVRDILITGAAIALALLVNSWITPDECEVVNSELPSHCYDILFP